MRTTLPSAFPPALALAVACGLIAPATCAQAQDSGANPFGGAPSATLPYDKEYPTIHYEQTPTHNAIYRLQQRLDRGQAKLLYRAPRGYLDSVLQALAIDRSSQTLVYSRTSLQVGSISAATPRALYFNDETYVGWVQGEGFLELATMDSALGQVFYTLPNVPGAQAKLERRTFDCLACHDTYELAGGGVPRFLLLSTYTDIHGDQMSHEGQILTYDDTPLRDRWGGWYVTGFSGGQVHLGNILITSVSQLEKLDSYRHGNLATLDGLFDTHPYLTDKSDIVALLVLQHQVDVENLLTRVAYEVRTALASAGATHGRRSAELPAKTRAALAQYLDSLVDTMLFVDATTFTSPIRGTSGFDTWFEAQGPRDRLGRSLRELDLKTRLFRYPLSYLVYSAAFDGLPPYARDYVYGRFAQVLTGRDDSDKYAALSAEDRKAILEILTQTKPDFARYIESHGGTARTASLGGRG
ncbi:MAG TPA: hypothetical protein VMU67_17305 [Steroidobacteraceae bacterium]|nr:hypothetical protein [Steroidobacteraceae bacterium]